MTNLRFALAGSLALFALTWSCKSQKERPPEVQSPAAKPAASPNSLEPEGAEPPGTAGPAPSTATRVAREQAVVSLLRGQLPSERLPEIATDDGGVIDPRLRDTLAPRKEVVTTPRPVGLGDF